MSMFDWLSLDGDCTEDCDVAYFLKALFIWNYVIYLPFYLLDCIEHKDGKCCEECHWKSMR